MSHGNVYSASFVTSATSAAAAQTLVSLLTSAASRVRLREVVLHRVSSDINGAALEALEVSVWRGSSSTGVGAAITPIHLGAGFSAASSAKSQVNGPASGAPSSASASLLYRGALGQDIFRYEPCFPPMIENDGQKLHVSISAPSTFISGLAGTVTFEEIGRIPGL